MESSPKNLDRFGLIALGDFILHGKQLWKKDVDHYFSSLSHIKNDIAKGVRSCARDDYIIDSPILRKICSKAISKLDFLFSVYCALGECVTSHMAISSCPLTVSENIVQKEENSTMIMFQIRKANKRTNMVISIKKPQKQAKSYVSRQEKEAFNRDIWEYYLTRQTRELKF